MVEIEPERPGDVDGIDRVLRDAFEDGSEADLVAVLREDDELRDGCSVVAREHGTVVGYAAVAEAALVGVPEVVLGVLGPVAVAPDRQGTGIASELVRAALRACKRSGCDAVVLEGDPEFYERFGFERADAFGLESDLNPPPGTFLVWECWPDALDGVGGQVRHPVPFHAL